MPLRFRPRQSIKRLLLDRSNAILSRLDHASANSALASAGRWRSLLRVRREHGQVATDFAFLLSSGPLQECVDAASLLLGGLWG